MLIPILIGLILAGLVAIAVIQWKHHQWVKREFNRNALAHGRIVKALPISRRNPVQIIHVEDAFPLVPNDLHPTRVWPQAQPAPEPEDWADDFPRTEQFELS